MPLLAACSSTWAHPGRPTPPNTHAQSRRCEESSYIYCTDWVLILLRFGSHVYRRQGGLSSSSSTMPQPGPSFDDQAKAPEHKQEAPAPPAPVVAAPEHQKTD
ncbi:hypothetical protein NMY22_g19441 [Coprinellus aureogranulatus]|nr:hypothetical protein NMY22_g19441 [Coprinellus aureogranulatus]